jgi:hypothetical protein
VIYSPSALCARCSTHSRSLLFHPFWFANSHMRTFDMADPLAFGKEAFFQSDQHRILFLCDASSMLGRYVIPCSDISVASNNIVDSRAFFSRSVWVQLEEKVYGLHCTSSANGRNDSDFIGSCCGSLPDVLRPYLQALCSKHSCRIEEDWRLVGSLESLSMEKLQFGASFYSKYLSLSLDWNEPRDEQYLCTLISLLRRRCTLPFRDKIVSLDMIEADVDPQNEYSSISAEARVCYMLSSSVVVQAGLFYSLGYHKNTYKCALFVHGLPFHDGLVDVLESESALMWLRDVFFPDASTTLEVIELLVNYRKLLHSLWRECEESIELRTDLPEFSRPTKKLHVE